MGDQALRWVCWGLMAGAALAAAWFFEALFGIFFKRAAQAAAGGTIFGGDAEGARPSVLSAPPPVGAMGRLNARLLENPWLLDFLERNYYGLGQRADMEPP